MNKYLFVCGFLFSNLPLVGLGQVSTQKPVVADSVVRGHDGKVVVTSPKKQSDEIDIDRVPNLCGFGGNKPLSILIRLLSRRPLM